MDDAEAAVLRETERIIDHEYAAHEATVTIMGMFNIGHRQALLALHQIRGNFHHAARKNGVAFDDYVDSLTLDQKMAIFGFCVGAVCQRDMDLRLNPNDGTPLRPRTDFDI